MQPNYDLAKFLLYMPVVDTLSWRTYIYKGKKESETERERERGRGGKMKRCPLFVTKFTQFFTTKLASSP